jgi:hypothetical protein
MGFFEQAGVGFVSAPHSSQHDALPVLRGPRAFGLLFAVAAAQGA